MLMSCRPPPSPLPPQSIVVEGASLHGVDIEWYDVSGRDVVSLRESVRAAAPRNDDGEPTLGRTQWNATWTWKGEGEPCHVERVDVDVSLLVWLPRWSPGAGTDAGMIARWRAYLDALVLHERGHLELLMPQLAQLDHILRAAPCEDVDAVGAIALDAIRALNREYDAYTGHGRAQGARYWTAPEWGADAEEAAGWAP